MIVENAKHSKNIWEYSGISQNIESIFLDIWGRLNHLLPELFTKNSQKLENAGACAIILETENSSFDRFH